MKKCLVLVGAGHAHLAAFFRLDQLVRLGHSPLVISPSPHYTYSGMGPGVLSGFFLPEEGRVNIQRVVELRDASFYQGTVEGIDPDKGKLFLTDGNKISYDVVSSNIGSRVPLDSFQSLAGRWMTAKPIDNFPIIRERLLELFVTKPSPKLLVIGGGPAGVEISGNLARLLGEQGISGRITLVAGARLLKIFPEGVRKMALESLASRNITIIEGRRASALQAGSSILDNGERLETDFSIIASGVQLSNVFRESGLSTGPAGGLLVNSHLQSVERPEIFGGGDCIDFENHPLDKIGVVAYRQNPVLRDNIIAFLHGRKLRPFHPRSVYTLMFNLGDGSALFVRGGLSWKGQSAFLLKNFIDRRFMAKHKKGELP